MCGTSNKLQVSASDVHIQLIFTAVQSFVFMFVCVFAGCSVEEALEAASLHPAQLLGISNKKGNLNYGSDAGQNSFIF